MRARTLILLLLAVILAGGMALLGRNWLAQTKTAIDLAPPPSPPWVALLPHMGVEKDLRAIGVLYATNRLIEQSNIGPIALQRITDSAAPALAMVLQ